MAEIPDFLDGNEPGDGGQEEDIFGDTPCLGGAGNMKRNSMND